jgi:glycerophosphoryl diester phosphodiesterase
MRLFSTSDFAIGHRGACLQFPEHTESSYDAASLLGAGIVECDVTFTKDMELVCRHAQCDLHTTTDIVTRPELNAKCRVPWAPGVRPTCCTSDFTLAEIKQLCAKMDSSFNVNVTTARGYAFGGTADWRTDLYQTACPAVPTHKESIAIIGKNGGKYTPEVKAPEVVMPFNGFTQDAFVANCKVVQEYIDAKVPPKNVWIQSATFSDMVYLTGKTAYGF